MGDPSSRDNDEGWGGVLREGRGQGGCGAGLEDGEGGSVG